MLQHHSCVSAAAAYWPPGVISNVLPKLLPPHTMTLDPLQHLFEWVIQYSKLHWPWHWRSTVLFKTAYCFFFAKEQHFGLSDYLSQKAPMQLLIVLGNFLSFFFLLVYSWFILLCKFSYTAKWIRHTYTYPCFFEFPLHSGHTEQWVELLVLYSRFFISLFVLYLVVYICQSQSPNSFQPPFPPWYPYICSLYLCLYFCFANKIIFNIFLDSTCMC